MSDHEQVFDHRTLATRAIVTAVDDTGCAQTVTVISHDGVQRSGVEVHQAWGFASNPPANGSVVVLIANGGDPSDMIALMAGTPLGRLGGLAPGESALYAADGTRVHVKAGGIVEILAATKVLIQGPEVDIQANGAGTSISGTFSISGPTSITGDVTITGNTTVDGDLHVTGTIINP